MTTIVWWWKVSVRLLLNHSVRCSKFLFQALQMRPQGCQGCLRIKNFMPSQILVVWSANIEYKLKNAKMTYKSHCFWPYFGSLLSFSWILELQTNRFVFSTKFQNFWHPWYPWSKSSLEIHILVFMLLFKNSE